MARAPISGESICKEGGSEKAKYATIEDRKLVSRRAAAGVELVVP